MAAPYFYLSRMDLSKNHMELEEDVSKHLVQVLRMKAGDLLHLCDGRGNLLRATLLEADRKRSRVQILERNVQPPPSNQIDVGISLIKNTGRFEWFLEKVTEIGVSSIIPLLCARTEKQQFRSDRMKSILVSAMLQSQRSWLPELKDPLRFEDFITRCGQQQKFIAHCSEKDPVNLSDLVNSNLRSHIILIGPEGDFTKEEVELALRHKFLPVSLGPARLRTETAGVVAVTILNII